MVISPGISTVRYLSGAGHIFIHFHQDRVYQLVSKFCGPSLMKRVSRLNTIGRGLHGLHFHFNVTKEYCKMIYFNFCSVMEVDQHEMRTSDKILKYNSKYLISSGILFLNDLVVVALPWLTT